MKTMLPLLTTFTVFATALHLGAQEPQRPSQGRSGQGGQKGPPGGREGGFGGEGFRPPVHPLETALDANGDGVIDAKEIANAVAALKKLDKNGDGRLTGDEYRPAPPAGGFGGPGGAGGRSFGGPPGGRGQDGESRRRPEGQPGSGGGPPDRPGDGDGDFATRLFQNDKNKDGKLTKDELPDQIQRMFDRIDTNGDGMIDRREAEAFAERMKQRGGAQGQGQGTEGKRPPLEK
ncbi:MAG: EF-hand domain-containing protein [Limisphaerales bacterium]